MAFGKNREIKKKPNSNDILGCVDSQEIFELYLGCLPTKPISSPFREDKNPSFSLFYSDEHEMLMYKDFTTGSVGDCFNFVMKLFNIPSKVETFNRIAKDFKLDQFDHGGETSSIIRKRRKESKVFKSKSRIKIEIEVTAWTRIHSKYWNNYYLKVDFVSNYDVFPISGYFINGSYFKADDLAFAYLEEKDGIKTFKIYQPYSETSKWINNNDYSTWELWRFLPKKGHTLIITSSRKDAMVINSLFKNTDIHSCSLQSEGVRPKDSVIEELKSRFKNIYILYDNDWTSPNNPGRAAGKKLAQLTGFTQLELPNMSLSKDISDIVSLTGQSSCITLLKRLIVESIKHKKRKLNINN